MSKVFIAVIIKVDFPVLKSSEKFPIDFPFPTDFPFPLAIPEMRLPLTFNKLSRSVRVCQYAKVFLIRSSTLGNVKLILSFGS